MLCIICIYGQWDLKTVKFKNYFRQCNAGLEKRPTGSKNKENENVFKNTLCGINLSFNIKKKTIH